jgi:hypothetical protein
MAAIMYSYLDTKYGIRNPLLFDAIVDLLKKIFDGPSFFPADWVLLEDIDLFQYVPKAERQGFLREVKKAYGHSLVEEHVEEIVSSCECDPEYADDALASFRSDINGFPYLTAGERREWVKQLTRQLSELHADE